MILNNYSLIIAIFSVHNNQKAGLNYDETMHLPTLYLL